MGRKFGWLRPPFGEWGAGSPSNTKSPALQTYVTNTHNDTTTINLVCTPHIMSRSSLYGAHVGVDPK